MRSAAGARRADRAGTEGTALSPSWSPCLARSATRAPCCLLGPGERDGAVAKPPGGGEHEGLRQVAVDYPHEQPTVARGPARDGQRGDVRSEHGLVVAARAVRAAVAALVAPRERTPGRIGVDGRVAARLGAGAGARIAARRSRQAPGRERDREIAEQQQAERERVELAGEPAGGCGARQKAATGAESGIVAYGNPRNSVGVRAVPPRPKASKSLACGRPLLGTTRSQRRRPRIRILPRLRRALPAAS
ncbi:MAG: hypothetical protein K0S96_864 [Geminicoccaceae bacterium]|nr:hypothetical protein [Geminicoccaceae bacterium]